MTATDRSRILLVRALGFKGGKTVVGLPQQMDGDCMSRRVDELPRDDDNGVTPYGVTTNVYFAVMGK